MNVKRLQKEYGDITINTPDNFSVGLINDNINLWNVTIFGPKNSPYVNGVFNLKITFSSAYPFKPPTIKFLTNIFHPNVSNNNICLDILKDQWAPSLTMKYVLTSIYSLLETPNPDDPLDTNAARLYKINREEFNLKARKITFQYAQ